MKALSVESIRKEIPPDLRLSDISFDLTGDEIMCLLGPSGCGKTTLLRIIAGLEAPDQGQIRLQGKNVTAIPPHQRSLGMMFQEFALFPHKNVFENVAFGPRIQNQTETKIKQRCREALELVGLSHMGQRRVDELSGGERQRVALARSLAPRPKLLLLDEPMGSLDRVLRERLTQDLHQILKQINIPTVFVTHDHNEAFAIADKIAVMNKGVVEQLAKPEILYKSPKNRFVATFLGFQNFVPGVIQHESLIQSDIGAMRVLNHQLAPETKVTLLIRPESASIVPPGTTAPEKTTQIEAKVLDIRFQGADYFLTVQTATKTVLTVKVPSDSYTPKREETLTIAFKSSGVSLLEPN